MAWLAEAAFVFAHVIELVAAHVKVRLRIPSFFKYAPILRFSDLNSCQIRMVIICVKPARLCCSFGHLKVLLQRQARFAKLVDKVLSELLSFGVQCEPMVWEVFLILGCPIEGVPAETPVSLSEADIAFGGTRFWTPFLLLDTSIEISSIQIWLDLRVP